jgi:hypothetical protein
MLVTEARDRRDRSGRTLALRVPAVGVPTTRTCSTPPYVPGSYTESTPALLGPEVVALVANIERIDDTERYDIGVRLPVTRRQLGWSARPIPLHFRVEWAPMSAVRGPRRGARACLAGSGSRGLFAAVRSAVPVAAAARSVGRRGQLVGALRGGSLEMVLHVLHLAGTTALDRLGQFAGTRQLGEV